MRGALQHNTLDIVQSTADVNPLTLAALRQAAAQLPPEAAPVKADMVALLDSPAGRQTLAALQAGQAPDLGAAPVADPDLTAALEGVASGKPDSDLTPLLVRVNDDRLEEALRAAREREQTFTAAVKPISQSLERCEQLLAAGFGAGPGRAVHRDFTAARLRYAGLRYEAEARLNQAIANCYEVQVRRSNLSAERHRIRSERFFYGMLAAQAAVIVSTLAIAARQRNLLWTLAAIAGLAAIAFAVYVYLCV